MGVEAPDEYCRAIEAYLCRKNDGHLIRIVGPAFEQVLSWADRGVPLKIAFHGIDRYFERYYSKGARRRPVRIEFCEADVLDVFDDWRRAVGLSGDVTQAGVMSDGDAADIQRRHASLPAHLERVIARLAAIRGSVEPGFDVMLDAVSRELETGRTASKPLRGDARRDFIDRLEAIDEEMLAAARRVCDESALQALEAEAEKELAPFKDRLSSEAFAAARRAAMDRLLRERLRLPVITFD